MLRKIGKIIFLAVIVSALAIWQLSFIYSLPSVFSQINLVVIALVFTLFFFGIRSALAVAVISGLWFDIYSFSFFGAYISIFILIVIFSEWILRSRLTNRSLYSFLLLMLAATVAYSFAYTILIYAAGLYPGRFFLWRGSFWSDLFYQALSGEIISLLLFNLAAVLTRRFQPFFLEKR